jgi:hypothetical protein
LAKQNTHTHLVIANACIGKIGGAVATTLLVKIPVTNKK